MHKLLIMMVLLAGNLWAPHLLAAEAEKTPVIAFSTKFRHVDYLFTNHAEQAAIADGANYEIAIREVSWELISAVGRACSSVKNLEGIFIDRIHFKERHSLVVLGVLADLEFRPFTIEKTADSPTLQALFDAFAREHITMTRLADANGLELSMAK